MVSFGLWLRQKREEAELSRENLAERAGLSKFDIATWEDSVTGIPAYREDIAKLAGGLGIDPDEAFYAAGRTPPDIRGKILMGGPVLWQQLRNTLFSSPVPMDAGTSDVFSHTWDPGGDAYNVAVSTKLDYDDDIGSWRIQQVFDDPDKLDIVIKRLRAAGFVVRDARDDTTQ